MLNINAIPCNLCMKLVPGQLWMIASDTILPEAGGKCMLQVMFGAPPLSMQILTLISAHQQTGAAALYLYEKTGWIFVISFIKERLLLSTYTGGHMYDVHAAFVRHGERETVFAPYPVKNRQIAGN